MAQQCNTLSTPGEWLGTPDWWDDGSYYYSDHQKFLIGILAQALVRRKRDIALPPMYRWYGRHHLVYGCIELADIEEHLALAQNDGLITWGKEMRYEKGRQPYFQYRVHVDKIDLTPPPTVLAAEAQYLEALTDGCGIPIEDKLSKQTLPQYIKSINSRRKI